MVQLTINGIKVNAEEGMTILDAAKSVGISIPTLCHLKNLDPTGACRICAVEVEGFRGLTPSCAYPVSEGLVVETDSPRVYVKLIDIIDNKVVQRAEMTGMNIGSAPPLPTGTTAKCTCESSQCVTTLETN